MPGCHSKILVIIAIGIIYNITSFFPVALSGFIYILACLITSEIKPSRLIKQHKNIYIDPYISDGIYAYTSGVFNPFIVRPRLEFSKYNKYMNAVICHEEGHIKTFAAPTTIMFYILCNIVLTIATTKGMEIQYVVLISTFIFSLNFIIHVILEVVADKHCISMGYWFELSYLAFNIFKPSITNSIRVTLLSREQ
jgi:hypothetical protein